MEVLVDSGSPGNYMVDRMKMALEVRTTESGHRTAMHKGVYGTVQT